MMQTSPKGQSLQLLLTALLSITVILTAAGLGFFYYRAIQQQILQAQSQLFSATERQVTSNIARAEERAGAICALLAQSQLVSTLSTAEQQHFVPQLVTSLQTNPALQALYAGYSDGRFFLVRRMDAPTKKIFPSAPNNTQWLVQFVRQARAGISEQSFIFLDANGEPTGQPHTSPRFYDPRLRPWYQLALRHNSQVHTEPYRFSTTGLLGMTVAQRSRNRQAVIGADMRLQELSQTLRNNLPSPHSLLLLINAQREILVSTDSDEQKGFTTKMAESHRAVLQQLAQHWQMSQTPPHTLTLGGETWEIAASTIGNNSDTPHYLLMLIPRSELFAEGQRIAAESLRIPLIFILLMLPIGWLISRAMSRPIRALATATSRIQALDFTHADPRPSVVREMNELLDVSRAMKTTIQDFINMSHQLVAEQEHGQLMSMVLHTTSRALSADQAGLWLLQEGQLYPLLLEDGSKTLLGPMPLSEPLVQAALAYGDKPLQISSAPALMPEAVRPLLPHSHHRLTVLPVRVETKELLGLLILVEDEHAQRPVETHRLHYLKALIGFAAIAIENRQLANSLKTLMNALVELVANAIDTKSPYTGGHCQRVPEIAHLLAEAACQTTTGPFAQFTMSAEERETLFIASWLHDCGKVTTPEYVVDKATKLETLYDRIHEIRMRFELLKRDADIRYWQDVCAGGNARELALQCEREKAQLDEEFAFVAQCNQGSEFMCEEDLTRLHKISQRTWLRTLDDRLGLGLLEQRRLQNFPPAQLPVQERLLCDKPEQMIARPLSEQLAPGNRWGFNMTAPTLQSHRGELHNLSIQHGTLNNEERYIINEHIVTTIKMLNSLPMPKHLARVAEIAGGHHERIDGHGYPRGLKGEEMSVLARIMAIADVFEALTASDRPYKPAKRMSEVLGIMSKMTEEGHLDPELFHLFIKAGVWRDYANKYLAAEQNNVDDATPYLAR